MTSAEIDLHIQKVVERISSPQIAAQPARYEIELVKEWKDTGEWPFWQNQPGVYFFELNGRVKYIGRALCSTLKERIKAQITPKGESWKSVVNDMNTVIGILPLPSKEWFWVAAIEAALIEESRRTSSDAGEPFMKRI